MTVTIDNPELKKTLIKLGLSGMVDCLPQRNNEAIANQMTYPEFLQLLAHDELLLREQRRYERRLKKADFKGQKTIENFDFSFNASINQSLIRDLATCHFIKEKYPVLIMGPCGTGKSHLAQALGHCALQKGYDVVYTNTQKISDELQAAKAINRYTVKLKSWAKIHLLIIDDFGLKPLRHPQDEDMHALIAERSEMAATLFTSNLDLPEWQQAFTNKLLGVATIDRLRHHAYQLILTGKSYRGCEKNKHNKQKNIENFED
jgi:DNA replication protein DnaC